MNKKTTRIKTTTFAVRYQSREEVEIAVKELGDVQRNLQRTQSAQNDELAAITERYASDIQQQQETIKTMQAAIQAWCESHRDELTNHGKTKTGSFNTGEVQWRQRPPSVGVRGIESVITNLKTLGLTRFIRTKEEINKEAMLNEPDIATTVAGITIKQGVEDFVITPFEQQL